MTVNLAIEDDERGQPLNLKNILAQDSLNDVNFSRPSVRYSDGNIKKKRDNESKEDLSGELSIFQKVCFGIGGLPYQMTSNCLGLFIPTFMLEIAGLRPRDLSIILLYGKLWDAFTDPLIGYVASKTDTRYGKLRPWILFSAPFAVFCYMMIWYVPDMDKEHKIYYYLFFYCGFQTFLSCLHVPYTALTMYLTHDQKQRDSATGYRMGLEVIGIFMAASIQGSMITIYGINFSCKEDKEKLSLTSLNDTNNFDNFTTPAVPPERVYNKLGEGYLVSAGIMGTIYLLSSMTTFFGTKEIKDVMADKDNRFFGSIKKVFKSKAYVTLLLTFLFNSLAGQLLQTNIALYCKHAISAKDQYQLIIIVLLLATILAMPFWQYVMIKYGKKFVYSIGLISFIPCLFPLMFISDQVWFIYFLAILCGISMSSHFLIPWSMLPDVIDDYMVKHGERKEAIFYSFFVFFTKLSAGLSVAMSSMFLEVSGYVDCPNGCCTQPDSTKYALRLLLVPVPITLIFFSMLCLKFHPISDKRRRENKVILENMRKTKGTSLTSLKYINSF